PLREGMQGALRHPRRGPRRRRRDGRRRAYTRPGHCPRRRERTDAAAAGDPLSQRTATPAMKCLIIQPIHEAGLALLRRHGIEPVACPAPDMATVARHIPGCEAVITRNAGLDAGAFAAADRLRAVVVHGTGHDPIDKEAAARKGVVIANTPGANARSVAELALGLALAAARRIPAADRAVSCGREGFRESASFTEFSGKTALVVGWGAIGREVGLMLDKALGMHVLVHSPRAPDTNGYERVASLAAGL